MATKTKSAAKVRAVVVCTDKKGVFFGYTAQSVEDDPITLERARMCSYWSAATKGVLGLAATGPADGSRIGPQVPSMQAKGLTAVIDCTEAAAKEWESGKWR